MRGHEFFYAVMCLGSGFLGLSGLAGLHFKRQHWDKIEAANLRLSLEFGLFSVVFALLPFLMVLMFESETVAWSFSSLFLAIFLLTQIGRIFYGSNLHGARWPLATIFLLALSSFFSTIETVNAVAWASSSWYAWGMLWLVVISAIQFVAFVCYDRAAPELRTVEAPRKPITYGLHGDLPDRLRRHHRPNNPDGSANTDTNIHRDPVAYARSQRYPHLPPYSRPGDANRRPVAHAAIRPKPDSSTGGRDTNSRR
jgi:hypothetical protein